MLEQQNQHAASPNRFEQRRNLRYPLYTSAALVVNERVQSLCWVKNLSIDGALVGVHEKFQIGTHLKLLLHLPWYKPVPIEAEVVRKHPSPRNEPTFGLRFWQVSRAIQIKIDQAIKAAEKCANQPREAAVLIISDETETRYALEKNLYLIGARWVLVHTPLDAIRWLQDWKIKVDTVLVDLSIEHFNVLTMLRFLADEHPSVRRVLISNDQSQTLINVAAAYGKVNAIVENPSDCEQLEKAIRADL
jgi:CheY-like chemotaxis protein